MSWIAVGTIALQTIQSEDKKRRQSILDANDAKYSAFPNVKSLNAQAPDHSQWINALSALGSKKAGDLQVEAKARGENLSEGDAYKKLFGFGGSSDPELNQNPYEKLINQGDSGASKDLMEILKNKNAGEEMA